MKLILKADCKLEKEEKKKLQKKDLAPQGSLYQSV